MCQGLKKMGMTLQIWFFSGDSLCPLLASRRLLCRFRVEIVSAAGDNGCQMLEMWNRLMLYAPFHSPFHRVNSDSTYIPMYYCHIISKDFFFNRLVSSLLNTLRFTWWFFSHDIKSLFAKTLGFLRIKLIS